MNWDLLVMHMNPLIANLLIMHWNHLQRTETSYKTLKPSSDALQPSYNAMEPFYNTRKPPITNVDEILHKTK